MIFLAMPSLELIGIAIAVFLVALLPTRRLFIAGWSSRALVTYFVVLMVLGLLLAVFRGEARLFLPMAVVVYVAPFVVAPVAERIRSRLGPGRRLPPRDVTPRDVTPRDGDGGVPHP